ncbi:PREDICTED: uncharacterized protein LOC104813566 isoform X3 [Tarenaya hassleriana]|nr:PREDICTED: uncharacterized protein LOC104813566 isoform X3 [Tarenaya hassleriana]XP_010539508.1 PREDICTED: uncharacterized protein LOC104813566 isoform X3 [Tarenaya hassleriana]XP_010539509.1 PREDICTED: uncharacterized protein LOC104813566 isoform X3 [Tarenaya hassleriana]
MDNSTFPSQGSISSISASNQNFDSQAGARSSRFPTEFVNDGLLLWNQTRERWVGKERHDNRVNHNREPKLKALVVSAMAKLCWICSWNPSYDSLLGSNKPFPQPLPLSEMVEFLVDIWEQEGLYD